jgi:hypothetical protein
MQQTFAFVAKQQLRVGPLLASIAIVNIATAIEPRVVAAAAAGAIARNAFRTIGVENIVKRTLLLLGWGAFGQLQAFIDECANINVMLAIVLLGFIFDGGEPTEPLLVGVTGLDACALGLVVGGV